MLKHVMLNINTLTIMCFWQHALRDRSTVKGPRVINIEYQDTNSQQKYVIALEGESIILTDATATMVQATTLTRLGTLHPSFYPRTVLNSCRALLFRYWILGHHKLPKVYNVEWMFTIFSLMSHSEIKLLLFIHIVATCWLYRVNFPTGWKWPYPKSWEIAKMVKRVSGPNLMLIILIIFFQLGIETVETIIKSTRVGSLITRLSNKRSVILRKAQAKKNTKVIVHPLIISYCLLIP